MSRTDKDIPFYVRVLHAYQEGKVEHDHLPHPDRVIRRMNLESERIFFPHDKNGIGDYIDELRSLGHEPIVEEFSMWSSLYGDFREFSQPYNLLRKLCEQDGCGKRKMLVRVFFYDYRLIESKLSSECTSVEFFEPHDFIDIRDEKIVSCVPDIKNRNGYVYEKNEFSRSSVKQVLRKVRDNLDDVDELASVPELNMRFDKKI